MLLEPMTEATRASMPILRELPDLLQTTLGMCGEANYLMGALALTGMSHDHVLQRRRASYVLPVEQHGIDFLLRHVPQDAEELANFSIQPTELWVVEGFVLHLAHWKGGLRSGITAGVSGTQLLQAFGVPASEALQMPQMLCFEKTENERRVGVVALIDSDSGQIESLIIKHQGELTLATALPPWPQESSPTTRVVSSSTL